MQDTRVYRLKNGITLLGAEIPTAASVALSFLVPAGVATESSENFGISSVLVEMLNKGAGPWDSRALSAKFEDLGAQRSSGAGIEVSAFTCAALSDNLSQVIDIYATLLLEPTLPAEELQSVVQLALQELKSLEDEPASKVMVELAKQFYPEPFGRCQLGTREGLLAITPAGLRNYYQQTFSAEGAVIGVAGRFDWERTKDQLEERFGGWGGKRVEVKVGERVNESRVQHLQQESAQVQIALAHRSVPLEHPEYYTAKVIVGVLSGGMAGRLFIEVREKRGLVYRVSSSHNGARGRGAVFTYAGTTPENAEETLKITMEELRKVKDGVSAEELKRSKADLKSRVIMSSESSSARASHLVNDWWNIGRVRTLDEIKQSIDKVSNEDIRLHLEAYPVSHVTMVTLGPKALTLPL